MTKTQSAKLLKEFERLIGQLQVIDSLQARGWQFAARRLPRLRRVLAEVTSKSNPAA